VTPSGPVAMELTAGTIFSMPGCCADGESEPSVLPRAFSGNDSHL
jgi:hypothetical protein